MSDSLSENAFIGRTSQPTDADLARALGPAKAVWDQCIAALAEQHGVNIQEWNSYSVKAGWALRLKHGKRTMVWMAPCNCHFRVMFILGDRAVQAARKSKLPAGVLKAIDEAPKYPEGTGIRLPIKSARDLAAVKKLAFIKMKN